MCMCTGINRRAPRFYCCATRSILRLVWDSAPDCVGRPPELPTRKANKLDLLLLLVWIHGRFKGYSEHKEVHLCRGHTLYTGPVSIVMTPRSWGGGILMFLNGNGYNHVGDLACSYINCTPMNSTARVSTTRIASVARSPANRPETSKGILRYSRTRY